MSEDIKMSEWFSGNAIKVGNGISDDHGIIVLEGYKWAVLAAIKAINNHDPMALRIKELEAALIELMDKASECDSWESFPDQYLDDAYKALEQNK